MTFLLLGLFTQSNAQTTLAVGDLSFVGFNSNSPDNFTFVTWVDIANGTYIKFTDGGFNTLGAASTAAGNARASENFVIWQNNTGATISKGTVIKVEGLTTTLGVCTAGSTGGLNGLSASGDQLFAYQSSTNTGANPGFSGTTTTSTFSGSILFGLNFGSSWLSTGTSASTTSYLPSELNVANGNIVFSIASTTYGEYTGSRSNQLNMSDYKALVNSPSNWTTSTGAGIITLNTTAFTLTAGTPTITTTGTLSGVNSTYGSPSPTPTTFTVSASSLTSNLSINAPAGFEISQTSPGIGGYASSQTLVPSSGSVSSTTIYVRLAATDLVSGSPYSGNITVTSTGATSISIPTVSSTVSSLNLTITGITANNKVFNGNTIATLSGTPTLVGVITSDISNVILGGTPIATFASSAVGIAIPVTVTGYTISGSAIANYTLSQPSGLSADITSSPTPVITSALTASATYGSVASTYTITATNSPTSYAASGLPPGLSINTTNGQISGTPTDVVGSPYSVSISATNAGGTSNATLIYTINKVALTINGAAAASKIYDRSNTATISGTLNGVVGSDNVILSNTGLFAQFTIGTSIAVTSSATISGSDAGKYTLTLPTGLSANITPLALTISAASALNKTFDATTTAILNGTLSGVISPDVVTLNLSGTFASSAIGNGISVTSTSTITGADASNYTLTQPTGLTANISAATATLGAGDLAIIGYNTSGTPDNFAVLVLKDLAPGTVFYANDNEVATAGGTSFTDLAEGEASFTVKAGQTIPAGTVLILPWGGSAVSTTTYDWSTTSGFGLGNNNEELYLYTASAISSLTPTNFIYFAKIGTSPSSVPSGLSLGTTAIAPNGSGLRYTTTGATYAACVPQLLAAIGSISTNWNTTGATTIASSDWTFNVFPSCATPIITTSGTLSALSTVYGTASSTTTFTASATGLATSLSIAAPSGFEVSSDNITFSSTISLPQTTGVVAATTIFVRISATATVAGSPYSGNIIISSTGATSQTISTVASTVTTKALTISGISVNNKVFDGNTTATLSGTPSLVGVTTNDLSNVILGGTPTATFASAAIGTGIAVTITGYSITGSAISNYTLSQPTGLTADITASPTPVINSLLTASAIYGSPAAAYTITATNTPTSYNATGLPSGLSINTTTGQISGTPTVYSPTAFSVTISATNVGGTGTATLLYTINKATLTVSNASANNKVYDRNTSATISGTLAGIVGSDNVTLNGTGTFSQFIVGTSLIVTSTSTITGTDANKYNLTQPAGLTANITPLALTIASASAQGKQFDGTTTATLSGTLAGVISPDVVTLTLIGNFATSAIGSGIAVTSTSTISGTNAGNYSLTQPLGLTASIFAAPSLTEIILPQYMQGLNGTNSNRVPFAYRAKITNLIPGATYRYTNQVVIASDLATASGAGNIIFANSSGFVRTTSPSFATAGNYGTLVADVNGDYIGWFISEPTGNATRFLPGTDVLMRIALNDGAGGTSVASRVTTTNTVKVINFSTTAGANNGTALSGNSNAIAKNFVFAYDNVNATGRPISGTFVESDGTINSIANSYSSFYATSVDGVAGAYGFIIPNTNSNGVRRIEQLDFATASLVGCANDADGVWPSGTNTVNPLGGTTALNLSVTDAPLNTCASPASVLNLVCFIEGYYVGASTMTPVLSNQGIGTSTTDVDNISIELHDETTFALVATTTAMLHTDGTATATFSPAVSGSYYVSIGHRNALKTWSGAPIVFGTTPISYNFSTSSTQAYTDGSANNMREIEPGVWAFWSGDINQDGVIDGSDGSSLDNDSDSGAFGFLASDLNGDGSVDGSDYPFFNNNSDNSIFSQIP